MDTFSGDASASASASPSPGDQTWLYATVSSAPPKRPAGRTKFRETRHPVYKGVRRRGAAGRWVCEVREPNKKSRIWLGTFPTAEMAARAHDMAAMILRGRSACLNFADSAWLLQVPPSFSGPRDIARAAAEAAEAFKPVSSSSGAAAASPAAKESSGDAPSSPLLLSTTATTTTTMATPSPQPEESSCSSGHEGGAFEDMLSYEDMDLGYCYYSGMAEALLVEPPPPYNWDDMDGGAEVPLWSYSF